MLLCERRSASAGPHNIYCGFGEVVARLVHGVSSFGDTVPIAEFARVSDSTTRPRLGSWVRAIKQREQARGFLVRTDPSEQVRTSAATGRTLRTPALFRLESERSRPERSAEHEFQAEIVRNSPQDTPFGVPEGRVTLTADHLFKQLPTPGTTNPLPGGPESACTGVLRGQIPEQRVSGPDPCLRPDIIEPARAGQPLTNRRSGVAHGRSIRKSGWLRCHPHRNEDAEIDLRRIRGNRGPGQNGDIYMHVLSSDSAVWFHGANPALVGQVVDVLCSKALREEMRGAL